MQRAKVKIKPDNDMFGSLPAGLTSMLEPSFDVTVCNNKFLTIQRGLQEALTYLQKIDQATPEPIFTNFIAYASAQINSFKCPINVREITNLAVLQSEATRDAVQGIYQDLLNSSTFHYFTQILCNLGDQYLKHFVRRIERENDIPLFESIDYRSQQGEGARIIDLLATSSDMKYMFKLNRANLENFPPDLLAQLNEIDIRTHLRGPYHVIIFVHLMKFVTCIANTLETIFIPDIDASRIYQTVVDTMYQKDSIFDKSPKFADVRRLVKHTAELFNKNFHQYYREYVITNNPNTLFESYYKDIDSYAKEHKDLYKKIFANGATIDIQSMLIDAIEKKKRERGAQYQSVFDQFLSTVKKNNERDQKIHQAKKDIAQLYEKKG